MDTSALARRLRGLVYDKIMTRRATGHDLAEADRIAAIICPRLTPPSKALTLLDLEHVGRAAFARLDMVDRVADYADAERDLNKGEQQK